jgi:hypothetical protein
VGRGALGYLIWHSFRNRTAQQVRRLRQPRYVVALLVGIGYLFMLAHGNAQPDRHPFLRGAFLELGLAAGLLFLVGWTWISSGKQHILAYSTAEVMFLFPAPLSRRALVRYKLLRAQVVIVATTLLWVVILGAGRGELPVLLRALSLWCLFTTIHLHRMGAAMARSSAAEHGRFGMRRHTLLIIVLVVAAVLVIAALLQAGNRLISLPAGASPLASIEAALRAPLALVVLWPFRLLAHPLASTTGQEWLRSFPWAAGLLVLHYIWVIRSDAAYEEAAADASFERARMLAARRTGARISSRDRPYSPALWPLTPAGDPARAILWKNVAMLLRRSRLRTWVMISMIVALTLVVASAGLPAAAKAAGTLLLVWGGFFFALGPQWIRNDLRTDLAHLELLRSYPLASDAVIRMEAASSAFILSLSQLTLLLLGGLALMYVPAPAFPGTLRLALAAAIVVVLPALNFVGMLLQNGAALLLPGWVRIGPAHGGVETLGQSVLTALAYIFALVLVSILPATGAVGLASLLSPALRAWAAIPAACGAAALLLAEGWLLSLWLATVYVEVDPGDGEMEARGMGHGA